MSKLHLLLFLYFCLNLAMRSFAADCEVYGLALKKGESKTVPGKCSLITCDGKGYEEYTIKACPNAYAPPHCNFVPVDLGKPYPDCCPRWAC